MDLYRRIDLREVAPSVHAPALILHPRDDRLVPLSLGRDLAQRLPNSQLVELPGTDHLWFGGERSRVDLLADELQEFLTGRRHERETERVLTTVLFTDIVGSTGRAAELGDQRWRELLERHHAVVREQLERFGGREVGTAGDGFIASFEGPARAVRCADAIIDATAERSIPIRAGVHTGECELIDGDLAGLAVHIGARIGAIAGAGEVLVSGTVRDLVVGSELEFRERGEHELRGVPGSWRVFELAGSGVPA
jgi:class 3 adenylate cyclase